jgi:hypothetical protein
MEEILIEEYNYPLPDERIAKYPLAERDQSKLLIYRNGQVSQDHFHHIFQPEGPLCGCGGLAECDGLHLEDQLQGKYGPDQLARSDSEPGRQWLLHHRAGL